jgi:hypothetical protein
MTTPAAGSTAAFGEAAVRASLGIFSDATQRTILIVPTQ